MSSFRVNIPGYVPPKRAFGEVPYVVSTASPGLIVILLDQSASMKQPWTAQDATPKSVIAASNVNRIIARIISDCEVGTVIRNRMYIAVLGYSSDSGTYQNDCRSLVMGWPETLASRPEAATQSWVRPEAAGGTPMGAALAGARRFLEGFLNDPGKRELFYHSIPPVILNVTDGLAQEIEDPRRRKAGEWQFVLEEVHALKIFETPQGFAPLLFHAHISGSPDSVFLPNNADGLDAWGKNLFQIASAVPDSWIEVSRGQWDPPIAPGATGLIMNAKPEELFNFLTLATRSSAMR